MFKLAMESQKTGEKFNWRRRVLWHGGSTFDAWFTASSFQVAQVLLNLPYSFAQMGMLSGVLFQIVYGFMGCWTTYMVTRLYVTYKHTKSNQIENHHVQWHEVVGHLLGPWWKATSLLFGGSYLFLAATIQIVGCGSTIYYLNDSLDKRTWTLVFLPCLLATSLIPNARNYRVWSFFGVVMTTFAAWYLTVASAIHGQKPGTVHNGPFGYASYFTGATNILLTFGGHSLSVEFAAAMWEPEKFKITYMYAILYIFTITIPSTATVYWAFGDSMLHNSNAFAVLPSSKFRSTAIVLMLMHQFIELGMVIMPLYLMWEKLLCIHHSNHYLLKTIARLPVCLGVWFMALAFPFFGPINSVIGSFFTSIIVYIIPCLAHMMVYRTASARKNAIEQPPQWLRSWVGVYCINFGIVVWIGVVGSGIGGWASILTISMQVHSFGLFAKCYQCKK